MTQELRVDITLIILFYGLTHNCEIQQMGYLQVTIHSNNFNNEKYFNNEKWSLLIKESLFKAALLESF